jgi:hypothetical protein
VPTALTGTHRAYRFASVEINFTGLSLGRADEDSGKIFLNDSFLLP